MPYCLGLHIEDNLIKYAKVQLEKDSKPKVGSHGIVFYDNLNMAIEQIIKETYSHNIDIATNLNNEMYDYTEVFSGIKQASLEKHLKLYFAEEVCPEKKINPASFQSKYVLGKKKYDEDKVEAMYISANKADIAARNKLLKNKVKKMLPVSLANLSLIDMNEKTNAAILNIDSSSSVTIVLQGRVKKVININVGMSNILAGLNKKYGSYAKSYKQCKSITLFNENTKELLENIDTEDLNKITPLLDDLGQRLATILKEYQGIVNNVYVTGLGIAINNIDLYLEEMLNDVNVEILKPSFLLNNLGISNKIKDFAEVNSAIALAISSGKVEDDDFNFVSTNIVSELTSKFTDNKLINSITSKIPKGKEKATKDEKGESKIDFVLPSVAILHETATLGLILLAYIGITSYVSSVYDKNTQAINDEMNNINETISKIELDTRNIATNRRKYEELDQKIQKLVEQMNDVNGITYDVPNLLSSIALVTPDEVVITKINITTDKKVIIEAQCNTYAPLGFFVSELKNNQIMMNIKTSIGLDNNNSFSGELETEEETDTESQSGQKITITGEIL